MTRRYTAKEVIEEGDLLSLQFYGKDGDELVAYYMYNGEEVEIIIRLFEPPEITCMEDGESDEGSGYTEEDHDQELTDMMLGK